MTSFALILFFFMSSLSAQERAYQEFSTGQGVSILSGLTWNAIASYRLSHSSKTSIYEKSHLPWDRNNYGRYSESHLLASNTLPFLNAVFLYHSYNQGHLGSDMILFTEVMSWSSAINLSVRNLKLWPRPLHGSKDPAAYESKRSSESFGSFYSGHSANSFAFATAYSHTRLTRYPQDPHNIWWVSGSYAIASLTAFTRMLSGKHYVSDVVAGALIGSGIAWTLMEFRVMKQDRANSTATSPAYLKTISTAQLRPLPGGISMTFSF